MLRDMNFVRTRRLAAVLLVLVGVGLAGCAGGGCRSGKCGLPSVGSSDEHKLGVSPYRGRYIEGGHGWR
jgi:hypothetical protein